MLKRKVSFPEFIPSDAIPSGENDEIKFIQEKQNLFHLSKDVAFPPYYEATASSRTLPGPLIHPIVIPGIASDHSSEAKSSKMVNPTIQELSIPHLSNNSSHSQRSSHNSVRNSPVIMLNDNMNRPQIGPPNNWTPSSSFTPVDSKLDMFHSSYCDMSQALEKCKNRVITPFNYLLMTVGWRPLGYDSQEDPTKCQLLNNILFMLVLISFCLFSYVYQYVACQWKLNLEYPTSTTLLPMSTTMAPSTSTSSEWMEWKQQKNLFSTNNISSEEVTQSTCRHVFGIYFVPNCLHLCAYLFGFFHFRWTSHEGIHALMEKVFHSTSSLYQQKIQCRLVNRLQIYFAAGALWMISGTITHILYYLSFEIGMNKFLDQSKCTWFGYVILTMDLLGNIITNLVSMAIILNYILTSDLIIFYANSIREKLTMRSMDLSTAFHEVLTIKQFVNQLNGSIGIMQSCILVRQAQMILMGFIIFILEENSNIIVRIYRGMFVFYLLPTLIYPITQAARVSAACSKIKKSALTMTTYGYAEGTQQSELDSFLLLTTAVKFKVKIFYVPMKSSYLMVILVGLIFVYIILSMSNYLGDNSF